MAHNIHNQKFISLRQPAWHGLGLVIEDEIGGVEAGAKLGLPVIYTEKIQTATGLVVPGFKAIVGKEGDRAPVAYSVVSEEYNEIKHGDFLHAWDKATGKAPIETIGLLGKGETLFVTTKLPTFDVKGDEVDSYLLAYNPLTGKDACTGRVTNVRVVCQNTLNASAANFTEQFRVIHVSDAATQIEKWLEKVWQTRLAQQQALQEAYNLLANYYPLSGLVKDVLNATYEGIAKPDVDPYTTEGLETLAQWEKSCKRVVEHRNNVLDLFEGKAVGSDLKSAQGTSWGLWNAVVEYEDHLKLRRKSSSALFGAGADRKTVAFDSLLALASR
jgi:phage/plasmid-like protein (TIGR03299 family)